MIPDKILALAVALSVITVFVIVLMVCVNSDKKKQAEKRKRCTIKIPGTLVSVNQSHSMMSNGDDYEVYDYDPVVQYEYNGKVYETKYRSQSNLWGQVEVNARLDVFVNPEDENDIYVPIPDEVRGKNGKNKIFLIAFMILWVFVFIACLVFG